MRSCSDACATRCRPCQTRDTRLNLYEQVEYVRLRRQIEPHEVSGIVSCIPSHPAAHSLHQAHMSAHASLIGSSMRQQAPAGAPWRASAALWRRRSTQQAAHRRWGPWGPWGRAPSAHHQQHSSRQQHTVPRLTHCAAMPLPQDSIRLTWRCQRLRLRIPPPQGIHLQLLWRQRQLQRLPLSHWHPCQ